MLTRVIESILTDVSARQRLLFATLLITSTAVIVALLARGQVGGLIVGTVLAAVLYITKAVWLPDNHGAIQVRKLSLWLVVALAGTIPFWQPWAERGAVVLLERHLPQYAGAFKGISGEWQVPSALVFGFALIAILIVNYFNRDASVMGRARRKVDPAFPERQFAEKAVGFIYHLRAIHLRLDDETHWSPTQFVPLEAEVEKNRSGRLRPVITNLMTALRAEDKRTRLFLVIGDPGSGKSIALRRLAVTLLDEFPRTGRIPLYINLKEWRAQPNEEISADAFHAFVRAYLQSHTKGYATEFVEEFFARMITYGRFYFILDSFDEMPRVLDSSETSTVITQLSAMFAQAFSGATGARGVVASRVFRRPELPRTIARILEVRPFSDLKIAQALRSSVNVSEKTIHELFRTRGDLVSFARNPFCAELLRVYLIERDQELPSRQTALFEHYIDRQLRRVAAEMRAAGLTSDIVKDSATDIAYSMYMLQDTGLDVALQNLPQAVDMTRLEAVASVLASARLARLNPGFERRFSFVHRRFHEFFIARRFQQRPDLFPFESIPSDSRWRDALVMYCETAETEAASEIAKRCWGEIVASTAAERTSLDARLRAVHCLRFLRDAFGGRPECVDSFKEALEGHIVSAVQRGDLLTAKLAVEGVGLLEEQGMERALLAAFRRDNEWLNETALRSCRQLATISDGLEQAIYLVLRQKGFWQFRAEHLDLTFSFSLSESFARLHRYCRIRAVHTALLPWSLAVCLAAVPLATVAVCTAMTSRMFLTWDEHRSEGTWFARATDSLLHGQFLLVGWVWSFPTLVSLIVLFALSMAVDWSRTSGLQWNDSRNWPLSSFSSDASVPWVASGLLLASFTAILPWPEIHYRLQHFRQIRFWQGIGDLVVLVGSAFVLSVVGSLLVRFEFLGRVAFVVVACLAAWSSFQFAKIFLPDLFALRSDMRRLKQARTEPVGSRERIAATLKSLKTDWGKRRYVEFLDSTGITPTGNWPGGRLPDNAGRAGGALARLEERWLGLTR